MTFVKTLLLVLLVIGVTISVNKFASTTHVQPVANSISVYERVKQSGELRCGYLLWPPFLQKDPNTGALSGVMFDLLNMLGEKIGVKVTWTAEMGMTDIAAALDAGRIDAFCQITAVLGTRGREMDYTIPYGYVPVFAVGRANDSLYTNAKQVTDLNNDRFRIVYMDGEIAQILARTLFPQARTIGLQQLTSTAELFETIVSKKADIGFFDLGSLTQYQQSNPGKLSLLAIPPIGTFATALPVKTGQHELRQMLNAGLSEMINLGQIDAIYRQHHVPTNQVFPVATPYRMVP